jgi:hypothetical protein
VSVASRLSLLVLGLVSRVFLLPRYRYCARSLTLPPSPTEEPLNFILPDIFDDVCVSGVVRIFLSFPFLSLPTHSHRLPPSLLHPPRPPYANPHSPSRFKARARQPHRAHLAPRLLTFSPTSLPPSFVCSPHFLPPQVLPPPRMNALLPSACMGTFVGTLHTILKPFLLRRMTTDVFPGAWFLSLCLISWFLSGVGFGTPCWVCSFVKWAGPC